MPLAPTTVDDLAWADLVAASRRRIPAASVGAWTLHAPVDPGVTLLELYAYVLEQRLYWMDQVPVPLLRAVLGLLGADLLGPSVAATVVEVLSAPGPTLAAGTALELARPVASPVFTTDEAMAVAPVGAIGVVAGGIDRTDDLRQGRGVVLLGADGEPDRATLILWMRAPPALDAAHPLALFLELDGPVAPEWDPDAAEVAAPAQLDWAHSASPGAPFQPLPAGAVHDGTGGLRRSGVVRLQVPAAWAPSGDPDPATGLVPYALELATSATTFTYPPRLLRAAANAAIAHHLLTVEEQQSLDPAGWLPLPGIELALARGPAVPSTVQLRLRERDGRWYGWSPAADLSRAGPGDRLFVVDRELGALRFGDGLQGRIPRLGSAPNASIRYQVGAGTAGDLGAALAWSGVDLAGLSARNLVPSVGGAEAETPDAARSRVAGELRRVERAVLEGDFVTLATSTPGVAVARADAAVGLHPDHPCLPVPGAVTVFPVPYAPRGDSIPGGERVAAPAIDPGALAAVASRLDGARLVATELFVRRPRYRPVRLEVRVASDRAAASGIQGSSAAALARFLDPLEGGADGSGWLFGEPLRPSALVGAVQAALEDGAVVTSVAIGLDGAPPSEDCNDVAIGPHDLVSLSEVRVRVSAPEDGSGGLR